MCLNYSVQCTLFVKSMDALKKHGFFFFLYNLHIIISCDTEDWSNAAENSALHHRNT